MDNKLSSRQASVFSFIKESIDLNNRPPTLEEIRKEFNFKTMAVAQQYVSILQDKGYIKKSGHSMSTIIITDGTEKRGANTPEEYFFDKFFLTTRDMRQFLGISDNTLKKMIRGKSDTIPLPQKIGGCYVWKKGDVLNWYNNA